MNSTPTPPWLKGENLEDAQPLNSSSSRHGATFALGPQQQQTQQPTSAVADSTLPFTPARLSMIHMVLKVVTMLLCMLMDITAILGIGNDFHFVYNFQ
jgi:hypothetical protein